MNNIIGIVVSILYIAIVMMISKKVGKFGKEASRKFVHISLSNWWIIAMLLFDNVIWASILPTLFIFINYASYKFNIIKTMEREENDGLGTVYYAISLLITSIVTFGIINKPYVGLCGILIMGYGDGLASIIGQKIKSKSYKVGNKTKTIAGSLTMLTVSLLILSVFFAVTGVSYWLLKALAIACILTVVEAVSIKGTDNIFVPVIALALVIGVI